MSRVLKIFIEFSRCPASLVNGHIKKRTIQLAEIAKSLITQCKKLRIGKELFSKRVRFRFSKNTVNSPLKERTSPMKEKIEILSL